MKRKVTKLERVLRKMKPRKLEYLLRYGARFNLQGGYTINIRD